MTGQMGYSMIHRFTVRPLSADDKATILGKLKRLEGFLQDSRIQSVFELTEETWTVTLMFSFSEFTVVNLSSMGSVLEYIWENLQDFCLEPQPFVDSRENEKLQTTALTYA